MLTQDTIIKATVSAYNINGWSPVSVPNSVGPTIQQEPHKMTQVRRSEGTL